METKEILRKLVSFNTIRDNQNKEIIKFYNEGDKMKIGINDIKFKIFNPGGNITALVINNNYSDKDKKLINNYILDKYKYVEQVGFLKDNTLEMAGGEFCINASRCAIYYLSTINKKLELNILDKKIKGTVKDNYVSINYTINRNINSIINNSLVNLEGISLIFLDKDENNKYLNMINDKDITNIMKDKLKTYNIDSKAIGIVLTDSNKIYPFIWVKDIDTIYFETACGSASIAYSLLRYKETNITNYKIIQPSGYDVEVNINNDKNIIKNIIFKGFVEEKNTNKR